MSSTKRDLQIRPVAGRILLQVLPPDLKAGALYLSAPLGAPAVRGAFRTAVVKALPEPYAGSLRVGDHVLVPPFPAREIRLNGETLVFIKEAELPAVCE